MTDAAFTLSQADRARALTATLSSASIWLAAFLSGFVIAEPAPYELYMAGVIGIWVLTSPALPRSAFVPLFLLLTLNIGGVISMTQLETWGSTPLYLSVSVFLAATTIFYAAIISNHPRYLRLIFNGYMAAAILTGLAGVLGYFGFAGDTFTRYGRAKGVFQDPNVFAPYLMLPMLFCLYGVLTRPLSRALPALGGLLFLLLAIFLSFSRAGWGLAVVCAMMLAAALVMGSASGRFRLRIVMLTVVTVIAVGMTLTIALQFDAVRDIFVERAQLVQDYDGARLGRFARHLIGFKLAMEKPLGIGPLEFGRIYGEDTHNIWLKTLFDYSWLGFASYMLLLFATLGAGFRILFRDRPWKPYLLCAYIVFVGHTMIGNVIDTDHWRHFYLLLGIIWGCVALEARHQTGPRERLAA